MVTTTKTRRKLDGEFHRRRRNLVVENVRDTFPGIRVSEAWLTRLGRGEWEFQYKWFYWVGPAAGANDATAKGWSAFLRQHGVAGYADAVAPGDLAFLA
jgi:hypothetical protein